MFAPFPLMLGCAVLWSAGGQGAGLVGFVLTILCFLSTLVMRWWVVTTNQKVDEQIRQACARFSSKTGCQAQYRTEYTGMCKPKGAQTLRGIALSVGLVCVGA
eukprot:gnl/TRDRNA2_/TRDRNA2_166136_c0_seq1.p1 gnl/TRDRNA2_/TRDRNA2_166136_c0~~gnl/TRDRNA2_/TRDRNA2_166136_c0_seq1.p1  ORF type:complete len:103 (+),score=10.09 gnl/TRDRNA2_/TRDRNA2_166136_c0_seq1:181-489(+)